MRAAAGDAVHPHVPVLLEQLPVAAQTEEKYTLPVALSLYSTGQNATNYSVLLAGAVLVVTPILLLFVFLQRYFIQGVAGTGIK